MTGVARFFESVTGCGKASFRGAVFPTAVEAVSDSKPVIAAVKPLRRPKSGASLQKLLHGLEDFEGKRFIRHGACQHHRSDKRAESQDRLRSRRTLVLAWK